MIDRPTNPLIYDRTLNDIMQKNSKGYYNASDLNRIGEWQTYIAELLNGYSYYVSITPKTNWQIGDIPRQSDIDKIKDDTTKLKNAFYSKATTPSLTIGINYIPYNTANDIEHIIKDLDELIENMIQSFIYCDTIYCGE